VVRDLVEVEQNHLVPAAGPSGDQDIVRVQVQIVDGRVMGGRNDPTELRIDSPPLALTGAAGEIRDRNTDDQLLDQDLARPIVDHGHGPGNVRAQTGCRVEATVSVELESGKRHCVARSVLEDGVTLEVLHRQRFEAAPRLPCGASTTVAERTDNLDSFQAGEQTWRPFDSASRAPTGGDATEDY